jgi:hypothetical protein
VTFDDDRNGPVPAFKTLAAGEQALERIQIAEKFENRPLGPTISNRSGPGTWVTQCTGHMGDTFGPNGLSSGSSTRVSKSKYPKS